MGVSIKSRDLPADLRRKLRLDVEAPKRAKRQDLGGYRSKLERDYAAHLELSESVKFVRHWAYEPVPFRVGKTRRRYTPDFLVVWADGTFSWMEVKGYFREKDKIRVDVVAAEHPDETFVIVTREKGQWKYRTAGAR